MNDENQTRLKDLPRLDLANLPTPVERLSRLSDQLEIDLWVKRDDLTGLAFGGNKTRKLEFLLADAQELGADTLVTVGAVQSNHCRQTAAAAARRGFACELVLVGGPPADVSGNLLLDRLLGAKLHWTTGDRGQALDTVVDALQRAGARPYRIPYGGSNQLGVAAFAMAMQEFLHQGVAVDRIVLASSSGGTQAGLLLGAEVFGFGGTITGISVEPTAADLHQSIAELLSMTCAGLGLTCQVPVDRIQVTDRYLGGGYAVLGDLEREAVGRFAKAEGLLLDPVYTGRAAGGLLDLVSQGKIKPGERILFWHTGGTPALFAYPELFDEASPSSS